VTIFFPDISQYTPVSLAGAPVAIARATISTVTDTHWQSNVNDAAAHQVPLLAYAFLNSGSLGVSAEAQADHAYSVIGRRPTMLDHEPNRGACATLGEACRWIDRFRSCGGVVHLHYLPKWTWSNPAGSTGLGKPGLQPLADRGMALVASNYTTYSDTGPGWAPYYTGCPVPVAQWQYSDSHLFNGVPCDWNAYRGTVAEYLTLAAGGTPADIGYVTGTTPSTPGDRMIVMAHEKGSNIDWAGDGVFRYQVPDADHRANLLVVMKAQGNPSPTSLEFNPGTLDALGPVVVSATNGVPTGGTAASLVLSQTDRDAIVAALMDSAPTAAQIADELAKRLGNG
jgi:hypothetical protein